MKSQRKNSLEFPRPKFQGEEKRHIISYSIKQRRTSQPTQKYICSGQTDQTWAHEHPNPNIIYDMSSQSFFHIPYPYFDWV